MKGQESAEDYLEAILVIKNETGSVRSIDVVHHMGFSKPSISRAMSLLRTAGHITVDKDGIIELTKSGLAIAEEILSRHSFLASWLVSLGVAPETAAEDACRIEHVLSPETFLKIKEAAARNKI